MDQLGSDFWEMKSDRQTLPDKKDELTRAQDTFNPTHAHILRLCGEHLGTYLEISYEWTWEEAMDMLEMLDVNMDSQKEQERIQGITDKAER